MSLNTIREGFGGRVINTSGSLALAFSLMHAWHQGLNSSCYLVSAGSRNTRLVRPLWSMKLDHSFGEAKDRV